MLLLAEGKQWAVVMSRCNEFREQVVELDYMYSSEGIHRRWDEGRQGMQFVRTCCEGRDGWHSICTLRSKGALLQCDEGRQGMLSGVECLRAAWFPEASTRRFCE